MISIHHVHVSMFIFVVDICGFHMLVYICVEDNFDFEYDFNILVYILISSMIFAS